MKRPWLLILCATLLAAASFTFGCIFRATVLPFPIEVISQKVSPNGSSVCRVIVQNEGGIPMRPNHVLFEIDRNRTKRFAYNGTIYVMSTDSGSSSVEDIHWIDDGTVIVKLAGGTQLTGTLDRTLQTLKSGEWSSTFERNIQSWKCEEQK